MSSCKKPVYLIIDGKPVETRPCRHCSSGPNGPKLRPIGEMTKINGGWYCPVHAQRKLECLKRERARA